MAVPYGLLAPDDPAFAATLERIETELVSPDGGVHRYAADTYYGGGRVVPAHGRARTRVPPARAAGDRERAEQCRRWIEAQAGPGRSLPEQVATRALHPERIAEWRASWGESACPAPVVACHVPGAADRARLMARARSPRRGCVSCPSGRHGRGSGQARWRPSRWASWRVRRRRSWSAELLDLDRVAAPGRGRVPVAGRASARDVRLRLPAAGRHGYGLRAVRLGRGAGRATATSPRPSRRSGRLVGVAAPRGHHRVPIGGARPRRP